MTGTRKTSSSTQQHSVRKTILLVVVIILAAAIGLTGYGVWSLYHSLRSTNPAAAGTHSTLNLKQRVNILLLGVDSRGKDDPGRSDSIILLGLDPVAKKIRIMSIPRDLRVNVPGHGYDKINSTTNPDYFSDGGIPLLEKTIQSIIPGIKINYYAKTNFDGFAKIIDALGGVTINVEEAMHYKAVDVNINLKPGIQHMDGKTALEYARFRMDAVGDFGFWSGEEHGRVARQKKLIKAVIAQTTSIRNVWKLPPVIRAVQSALTTDLLPDDMLRLALTFKNATDKDVTTISFPGLPQNIGGTSYVVISPENALRTKIAPLFGSTVVGH